MLSNLEIPTNKRHGQKYVFLVMLKLKVARATGHDDGETEYVNAHP